MGIPQELETIVLDKERRLRLTLKGMAEFEKRTGKKLLEGFDISKMTLEEVGTMIWACMIHEDKTLEVEAVMDMVDTDNMLVVMNAVTRTINRSMPKAKGETKSPLAKRPSRSPG